MSREDIGVIEPPEMIAIPPGRFTMGTTGGDRFANSTERPAHEVSIEHAFSVSRFPITEVQWSAFSKRGAASDLPVVGVNWLEATAYANWLSERMGKVFRLLTECEWEYCCRAGSAAVFSTGDDLGTTAANYLYDEHGFKVGPGQRTRAGTYPANAFGLEDMHGNVCEWVADPWRPSYDAAAMAGQRVIRGGAWDYMPRLLRSAWRDFASEDTQRDNLGFRLACDP